MDKLIIDPQIASAPALLIADENLNPSGLAQLPGHIEILSNRFDIAKAAASAGLHSTFNDFDFSVVPTHHFQTLLYFVSKEKAIAEHVIQGAADLLRPGGKLILLGPKNSGIKTHAKKAAELYSCVAEVKKNGKQYLAKIAVGSHSDATNNPPAHAPTAQSDYHRLRKQITWRDSGLYSKPGLFGWNKIDQGSALLAAQLSGVLNKLAPVTTLSAMDLGCGYGYLSAEAWHCGVQRIVATDNCAAALSACEKNFELLGINGITIPSDCAEQIDEHFDLVLCNPPFHQGFKTDSTLSHRFLKNAARVIKKDGIVLFVVNSFLPVEKIAQDHFSSIFRSIVCLNESAGFKVLELRR